jgi:hypothetical protein
MPKKVAPKLINTDHVVYAVLSEGNGFLKVLYGTPHFYDNLPRASGCFTSKGEAITMHGKALALARSEVEEAEEKLQKATSKSQAEGCEWYVKRGRERFKQAQDAIVVEIAIRGVV